MNEFRKSKFNSARCFEEANAWAVRLDDDPDNVALRSELEEWLNTDERHRTEFEKARSMLLEMANPALIEPVRSRRTWVLPVAASILILFGLTFFMLNRPTGDLVQTARAEQRSQLLADGTELTLDADSRVRVDFDEQSRRIVLVQGSAIFDIAAEARPFEVFVGDYRIEDIGTIFSVSLRSGFGPDDPDDASLTVAVAEGEVHIHRIDDASGPMVKLLAGERSELNSYSTDAPEVASISAAQFAQWRSGVLQYRNRPLREVLADLQRHYPGVIELSDSELAGQRVTGSLRTGDIKEAFEVLERVLPLEAKRTADNRIEVLSR
ncbi:MAG: FecR domain-containing protein [Verrucomicrobiota bacterium]